jgi:hypothetical protein
MNFSKLVDISEIIASLAILITLVYLALQTQQNTAAVQADARQSIIATDVQLLFKLMENPDITINWWKEDLTEEEKVSAFYFYIVFIRTREHQWSRYQNGILDEPTWNTYLKTVGIILSYSRARSWWEQDKNNQFDANFIADIDDFLTNVPISNRKITKLID